MKKVNIGSRVVVQKKDNKILIKHEEDGYYMLMSVYAPYLYKRWQYITLEESVIERDIDKYWTDIDPEKFMIKLYKKEEFI